jgi:hypothetical protein
MLATITHIKSNTIGDMTGTVTVFNSAGTTTTQLATDLIRPSDWNSNHSIAITMQAADIASLFVIGTGLSSSTNTNGISFGYGSGQWFEPFPHFNTASTQMLLSSMSNGTWYLDGPYELDRPLGSGQINMFLAFPTNFLGGAVYSAATTGSVSRSGTLYNHFAFYRQASGTNTTRLESVWTIQNSFVFTNIMNLSTANTSSGSLTNRLTVSFPAQWDTAGGVTYSTTSTSATSNLSASTMASTRYNSLISNVGAYISGSFMAPHGLSSTIAPGIYWIGRMIFTTTASAGTAGGIGSMGTYFGQASVLGGVEHLGIAYKQLGKSVSNSTTNFAPFHGFLATSTTNATSIIGTADIRGTTGQAYWQYFVSSY